MDKKLMLTVALIFGVAGLILAQGAVKAQDYGNASDNSDANSDNSTTNSNNPAGLPNSHW